MTNCAIRCLLDTLCIALNRRPGAARWIHAGGSAVSAVNEASATRAGEFSAVRDTAAVRELYPGVDHMAGQRPPSVQCSAAAFMSSGSMGVLSLFTKVKSMSL